MTLSRFERMRKALQQVADCQIPGCPKSNIWQSLMIIALCGMAVMLAYTGIATENFREVMYLIAGAIAFIKMNWNQGQILDRADTAAKVAADTKETLSSKIDEKAADIKQVAVEARDTAGMAVQETVTGNKLLEEVHRGVNGNLVKEKDKSFREGLEQGQSGSKF